MPAYKDTGNTWRAVYRYTDWKGTRRQTQKRGFATKHEALAWEREQLLQAAADLDMTFGSFVDSYTADMKNRLKENTWHTKEHIMRTKILPYFKNRKMCEIEPKDIIAWQNEMINSVKSDNKKYSPVYLKTLHNQLSAIFNHAVRFYGLSSNPAAKVGNMGKEKNKEIESVKENTASLKEVAETIHTINAETITLREELMKQFSDNMRMFGSDYKSLSEADKMCLGAMVNNTKSLSALFSKTV